MATKLIHDECLTRVEYEEIKYSWTIENFSMCTQHRSELSSEAFPSTGEAPNEWRLYLYPLGETEELKDYISLYLEFMPKGNYNVVVQSKFSFLNTSGSVIKSVDYSLSKFSKDYSFYGYSMFAKHEEVMPQLQNDTLIVNCSVKYEIGTINDTVLIAKPKVHENLSNDLLRLMEIGILSDVSLSTKDGTQFPAHRCVLAARSPIFAAMFLSDMKESKESVVAIEDVGADTLKNMLHFIYTGEFDVENCEIEGLLAAADKYVLEDLIVLCERELVDKLKVDNAVDYLILGDRFNAKILKNQALKLIAKNLNDVLKSKATKNLSSTLLNDILESVAKKFA